MNVFGTFKMDSVMVNLEDPKDHIAIGLSEDVTEKLKNLFDSYIAECKEDLDVLDFLNIMEVLNDAGIVIGLHDRGFVGD